MKGEWKGRLKVKKLEKEKMFSARTTQEGQHRIGCHTWKWKWINKEGCGRDEGEYEKDESCR